MQLVILLNRLIALYTKYISNIYKLYYNYIMKQTAQQKQKSFMKKHSLIIIGLVVSVVGLSTNLEATTMIGIIIAGILGPIVLGLSIRKKSKGIVA